MWIGRAPGELRSRTISSASYRAAVRPGQPLRSGGPFRGASRTYGTEWQCNGLGRIRRKSQGLRRAVSPYAPKARRWRKLVVRWLETPPASTDARPSVGDGAESDAAIPLAIDRQAPCAVASGRYRKTWPGRAFAFPFSRMGIRSQSRWRNANGPFDSGAQALFLLSHMFPIPRPSSWRPARRDALQHVQSRGGWVCHGMALRQNFENQDSKKRMEMGRTLDRNRPSGRGGLARQHYGAHLDNRQQIQQISRSNA